MPHPLRFRRIIDRGASSVEKAFPVVYGGKTFYNQMVWIPTFTHPDVDGVVFGGFWAGKYICSQPNATTTDDKPDVADSADPGSVPAISQYGVASWRYIDYWYARKACSNVGVGWHMMSAFEWASLAFFSQMNGTVPHGNNKNVNPPTDNDFPAETALLDLACNARNAGWYANLVGTGPVTWNHNHRSDGVSDLNGNMWEWNLGLHMQTADEAGHAGHAVVLGNLDVSLIGSPYGVGTGTATTLTDTRKAWTVNEFATMWLIDSAGTRFTINSNTATALTLAAGTPASGVYEIVEDTGTDISSGMSSGNKILTLRDADADLKGFAIPATSDATGAAKYGTDGYWFNTADAGSAPNNIRTALRGGRWDSGVIAGVFILTLDHAPSYVPNCVGCRLCKSL